MRWDPRTPAAGLCVPCRHRAVTKLCPFRSSRAPTSNTRLGSLTLGRVTDTKNALGGGGQRSGDGWGVVLCETHVPSAWTWVWERRWLHKIGLACYSSLDRIADRVTPAVTVRISVRGCRFPLRRRLLRRPVPRLRQGVRLTSVCRPKPTRSYMDDALCDLVMY